MTWFEYGVLTVWVSRAPSQQYNACQWLKYPENGSQNLMEDADDRMEIHVLMGKAQAVFESHTALLGRDGWEIFQAERERHDWGWLGRHHFKRRHGSEPSA